MRIFKSNPLLKLVNSYVVDSPQPSNLSFLWNFGSLLAFCLIIQIITGVTLAMHYDANILTAFNSVEHIMRDVNNGWLIRYLHSNTASAFFFIVYLHIGRGLYYGSYKAPRTLVWTIGTVIFILMIATAFLGYVLPYGQMSLWGATVITNLMSAIPWVGQDIVEFIWGGFSVNNATLNRFFALHFVLPFILAALALMHLIVLHERAGSGNPLGVTGNSDRLPFAPYFIFKDLITIFVFILVLSVLVFYMPNALGDSENYVMANPMQTPPAIVPEWYLLPFYAILRSIPNKLLGVIAMFSAILILLVMPFSDLSRSRGIQFRPISKIVFFIFIANFLILLQLGSEHVESPFIEFGQISTVLYFAHFLVIIPIASIFENSLVELFGETEKTQKVDETYEEKEDENYFPSYAPVISFLPSFAFFMPGIPGSNGPNGENDIFTRIVQELQNPNSEASRRVANGDNLFDIAGDIYRDAERSGANMDSFSRAVNSVSENQAQHIDVLENQIQEGQNQILEGPVRTLGEQIEQDLTNRAEREISRQEGDTQQEDTQQGDTQQEDTQQGEESTENNNEVNGETKKDDDDNGDDGNGGDGGQGIAIPTSVSEASNSSQDSRNNSNARSMISMVKSYFLYSSLWLALFFTLMATCKLVITPSILNDLLMQCHHFFMACYTGLTSFSLNGIIPLTLCDAARPWGIYFQDSGTPQMEALVELHDNIMFYLVIILFGVGWILISIINVYNNVQSPISLKYLSHGASIELIWTVTPAIILILIAFPSFKLLYLMDEVSDPAMVILAEGHQWYWSYQYADFMDNEEEFIEFDSYLVPESDLEDGALRMLEVDNRLIIPELTHVRFIVGGADVIHSFACPALGVKCDAYPGRLNQSSLMINRAATFYGQCSEICGILHSSMPIVIESVSIEKFIGWLLQQ